MESKLEEEVSIKLPRGTLLILFEYLARSYETWRKTGDNPADAAFALQPPDAGERRALCHLEGAIERTLPEIFSAEYTDLINEWKLHLTAP